LVIGSPYAMRTIYLSISLLLVAATSFSGVVMAEPPLDTKTDLCPALEGIKDGERRPMVVSGIYMASAEMTVLYDPNMPLCQKDIQPSTWVLLNTGADNNARLVSLLKQDGRAYVTLKGTLVGPRATPPDDPSVSTFASYAERIAGRRYGHLNQFRTELIVDKVLEARAVAANAPFSAVWRRPSGEHLLVQNAELPRYSAMARRAGIAGEVKIKVKVSSGKVASAEVESGDRILAAEALSNVKTWSFALQVEDEVFTSTFVYILERRKSGEGSEPKIELQLPLLVKVTAHTLDW
jgi:TonB family protein